MIDANQRWDVSEAITWVNRLAEFRPLWIEEPTCPDDILGHAAISKVINMCQHVWGIAMSKVSVIDFRPILYMASDTVRYRGINIHICVSGSCTFGYWSGYRRTGWRVIQPWYFGCEV